MFYSELVNAVNAYVENNFPTVDINRMIEQCEQRIYNTVQLPSLRKNVTGTLTAGNQYPVSYTHLTLPTIYSV